MSSDLAGWRADVTSPVFGGIGPQDTLIEQVRLARGGGSRDYGRGTFDADEREFLSVNGCLIL